MIGIGIDTGGTYTDAVIYDMTTREVLSYGKSLTTKAQLEIGIDRAMELLDQELIPKAELLALSTTLATNACLEDKGSRARLLMIGMNPDKMLNLNKVYAAYGLHDLDQLIFIDGKPEHAFSEPEEPDWEMVKEKAPEWFANCPAAGVCQIYPNADGGKLEQGAKKVLTDVLPELSVTTAHKLFDEVDPLKRGAGTLLNARLVPLVKDFMKAVKTVMKKRNLDVPIAIVRSDGSLMTESMAKVYPVETLLCGPAASVIGGSTIAGVEDALIVDMGGTTTDVAMVRHGRPLAAKKGVSIGKWKTTVQGLYVDTFLLGGDSAIRHEKEKIFLDGERVIPLSVLQESCPDIVDRLKNLLERHEFTLRHTRMIYEFFVLQKSIKGCSGYTEQEQKLCAVLEENGPLNIELLAELSGIELYYMKTQRLLEEGILMKSGLTPTDMMVLRGDFSKYKPDAALLAMKFLAANVRETEEEIPEKVYDLVQRKLYCNLARILLDQKYPNREKQVQEPGIEQYIEWAYEDSVRGEKSEWSTAAIRCELPIVGVGAPIHVFLPKVAELLGTTAIIKEHSPVANALGAIASQIVTTVQVRAKAEYDGSTLLGFVVFDETERHMFEEKEEAEVFARELARKQVLERSREQGASVNPHVELKVRYVGEEMGILFEILVEAVATDSFQL
ncbi:MAG: hypothetical protein MJ116_01520 [Lachnospiraceae bacterium]|nr:hypothetical protein [Lachnospiraceae bacterium]